MQTLVGQTLRVWATATSQASRGTCTLKHLRVGSLPPPPRPLRPGPRRDGTVLGPPLALRGQASGLDGLGGPRRTS